MNGDLIIANARVVTRTAEFEGGVRVENGAIAAVDEGRSGLRAACDFEGDYLLPGLVEMHTDNVEKHFTPRPGVIWPTPIAALLAHDTQIAGSGITTVLNAAAIGDYRDRDARPYVLPATFEALEQAHSENLLRAEHFLHTRCEVSDPKVLEILEPYVDSPLIRLMSVMDHTPGDRQWRDLDKFRSYTAYRNWTDAEFDAFIEQRREIQRKHSKPNRRAIAALCRDRGLPLASHDDTTEEHVEVAVATGVTISEFPCSKAAAAAARKHGLRTLMGAPNVVRGQSQAGNASALEMAAEGLLDGLSSDYMPVSLLHAAFILCEKLDASLPDAVAKTSINNAEMLGLDDRGEVAEGKRADLVRVRVSGGVPIVRTVWREGSRII
jgi:alpha-D-ribose 1-methylphosphonate 5-triphosphate diphosphatase